MNGQQAFELYDPSGLAEASITVSGPALYLLTMFDGEHTLADIAADFAAQFHQRIEVATLAQMAAGLAEARLLAGKDFEHYYAGLLAAYRDAPVRDMHSAADLGLDHDAHKAIDELLAAAPAKSPPGRIVGLVAPHLDYPRGTPCYSAAYSTLINRPAPQRVVVLGTNHFGRSLSAVATAKDFKTPLGTTPADATFISRLEACCGDLRAHELDHQREHSIELQLLICQHLWGAESFRLVPILCPDPCGPTGTAPFDGRGVDLRDLASALRALIDEDGEDTLIIAGADLSHVGAAFGDEQTLDDGFCAAVRQRDEAVLAQLGDNAADAFVAEVAEGENATRICSAGCIFTAMAVWPQARVEVLHYHQAVDERQQTGVTCAAAVLTV